MELVAIAFWVGWFLVTYWLTLSLVSPATRAYVWMESTALAAKWHLEYLRKQVDE